MQVLSSHFGMYSEFNVEWLAVSLREIICAVVGFKLCETTWNICTSYPYPTPTDRLLVLFIVDKKTNTKFFQYPFVLLGGEGQFESKVSCSPRT